MNENNFLLFSELLTIIIIKIIFNTLLTFFLKEKQELSFSHVDKSYKGEQHKYTFWLSALTFYCKCVHIKKDTKKFLFIRDVMMEINLI